MTTKFNRYLCLVFLLLIPVTTLFAERNFQQKSLTDSVQKKIKKDTIQFVKNEVPEAQTDTSFKPDPVRNIWLGAVIPGYGQIVNRKYWKLPIVYGGFLGCAFAISWNAKRYTSYKNAYLDITDKDNTTNSFLDIIPEGFTLESYGGIQTFTNTLKTGMDKSRYNRDLTVIVSVAYYGLTLVDAYVDAHLYDFDISSDLSMRIRPALMRADDFRGSSTGMAYGLKTSFNF